MLRDRTIACLLFAVAFFGLVMQRIYPFSDIPELVGVAITVVAVVSGLTGVRLWLRSSRRRDDGDNDGDNDGDGGDGVELESDRAAGTGADAGTGGSSD